MRRIYLLAAAAVLLIAPSALAQDGPNDAEVDNVTITGSRIVRQDFEAISPMTTVGSEQLEFTSTSSEPSLGWREASQRTANRVLARGSVGASAVRVVRACEYDLRHGDDNCAAN